MTNSRFHPLTALAAFFALACLLGWSPYLLAALGVGSNPENMPLGVVAAAAVVAAVGGRRVLSGWWCRVRSVRLPLVWLGVALLLPVAMHTVQVLINHGFGAPLPTSVQLAGWTALPGSFLMYLVLVGLGEEAGWTAFATPLLLRRYSFVTTFAVMASMRILWHLPLMIGGQLPWSLGVVGNAGFQLVILCVYRLSGDRWSTAALLHASLNTLGGQFLFQMVTGDDRARLGVIMSVAYVLLGLALLALVHARRAAPTPLAEAPRLAPAPSVSCD